jgi:hypothetical protein
MIGRNCSVSSSITSSGVIERVPPFPVLVLRVFLPYLEYIGVKQLLSAGPATSFSPPSVSVCYKRDDLP